MAGRRPDIYFQTREAANKFYDAVPDMVAASAKVSKQVMSAEYAGKAVSTVMIKTQQGYEAQTVAENIKRLDSRFADLGYVYPGGITANTSKKKLEKQQKKRLASQARHQKKEAKLYGK